MHEPHPVQASNQRLRLPTAYEVAAAAVLPRYSLISLEVGGVQCAHDSVSLSDNLKQLSSVALIPFAIY